MLSLPELSTLLGNDPLVKYRNRQIIVGWLENLEHKLKEQCDIILPNDTEGYIDKAGITSFFQDVYNDVK